MPTYVQWQSPQVFGVGGLGQVLSATTGTWLYNPGVYSYQWQTSPDGVTWVNIPTATTPSYVLQLQDIGQYTRCQVTGTNANGPSVPAVSATTGPTRPDIAAIVGIFGTVTTQGGYIQGGAS